MDDERATPGALFDSEPRGTGLDRHRADEAIYQGFNPGPMQWGPSGEDGMPVPPTNASLPLAPPLAPNTFVCMADTSEFVVRSERWGHIIARFRPELVKTAANGRYYVDASTAVDAAMPILPMLRRMDWRELRVEVEPLRPQCKFLANQLVDFQDSSDRMMLERLCTARRDDESFFLSVRDSQVHACELRSPPDAKSGERIKRFDSTKLKQGAERAEELGDAFDVDAALAREEEQADLGATPGSIFGNTRK